MTDLLVTTLDDGVATLTLNRPKAINSLNLEMLQAANEVLTSWAHDDSVREVVLRGEGAADSAQEPMYGSCRRPSVAMDPG